MTFASILEAYKNKRKKVLPKTKENKKSLRKWTFSETEKENVDYSDLKVNKKKLLRKEEVKKKIEVKFQDEEDIESEKKEKIDKTSDKAKDKEEDERLRKNLEYLQTSIDMDLSNITIESLKDEFEFLKIKKYELNKIKKDNEELIKNDAELKENILKFQEKLTKRVDKYNFFVSHFSKDEDTSKIKNISTSKETNKLEGTENKKKEMVTELVHKNLLPVIVKDKSDIQNKIKKEILFTGKYSNIGETIMRFLVKNKDKYTSGPFGYNPDKSESVEDWSIKRSIGIVEEFKSNNPDKSLVGINHEMKIILDVTDKKDIKIISISNFNKKNNRLVYLDDYKKHFNELLSNIFEDKINDAKKMQVVDIENSNTNNILTENQIASFREIKYMIGEVIGESSNSNNEFLESYADRVIYEMFQKCKKNNVCNNVEKRIFERIFNL